MSQAQNLLIAPSEVGLELDREPWLILDSAFQELFNAYVWRGRVKRRLGFQHTGRLRREIEATLNQTATGASVSIVDILADTNIQVGAGITTTIRADQPFSSIVPGSMEITVAGQVFTDNGDGTLTGGLGGSTINYATGAITLNFDPPVGAATPIDVVFLYYPTLPVMAEPQKEEPDINAETTYGFDTRYAYTFDGVTFQWSELPSTLDTVWTGSDSQLFWSTNYQNAFWTTNNNPGIHGLEIQSVAFVAPTVRVTTTTPHNLAATDPVVIINTLGSIEVNGLSFLVRSVISPTIVELENNDGSDIPAPTAYISGGLLLTPYTSSLGYLGNGTGDGIRYHTGSTWVNFQPPITATTTLVGGLMIIPYRQRLVVLNTVEGNSLSPNLNTRFPQRARWSQNGSVFAHAPTPISQTVDSRSWRSDIFGRGGFNDAPTSESIVTAEFVRDTLIVYFENSTWRLRYTGNEYLPFVWERANTELGSKSTFSVIGFDKGVMAIGERGIVASDGIDTNRIDERTPDSVFAINNVAQGPERVVGIRDYTERLLYWAYPDWSIGTEPKYNNRLFAFNYVEGTWAIFQDSYTALGRLHPNQDRTWASFDQETDTWEDLNTSWSSYKINRGVTRVMGGNQVGYTMLLNEEVSDEQSLYVQAFTDGSPGIVTIPQHNLQDNDFIYFEGIQTGVQWSIPPTTPLDINETAFKIEVVDANNVYLLRREVSGDPFVRVDISGGSNYIGTGDVTLFKNFLLRSKKFNPFIESHNSGVRLLRSDIYVDVTSQGKFTYNLYIDDNNSTPVNPPLSSRNTSSNIIPTSIPERFKVGGQSRIWVRNNNQTAGTFIQFVCTLSDDQMLNPSIVDSDFVLQGISLRLEPCRRLT